MREMRERLNLLACAPGAPSTSMSSATPAWPVYPPTQDRSLSPIMRGMYQVCATLFVLWVHILADVYDLRGI